MIGQIVAQPAYLKLLLLHGLIVPFIHIVHQNLPLQLLLPSQDNDGPHQADKSDEADEKAYQTCDYNEIREGIVGIGDYDQRTGDSHRQGGEKEISRQSTGDSS